MTAFNIIADADAYRVDGGGRVPRVTNVLRAALKFAGASADVIAAACQRGTAVHRAIELDISGTLDRSTLDPVNVAPYFEQWRRFRVESDYRPMLVEYPVASKRWGYAGRLDTAGRFGNGGTPQRAIELIDVKVTATVPVTVGPQTAGYAVALGETLAAAGIAVASLPIRRHCLHLSKRTYRLVTLSSANDWPVFSAALILQRWVHEHDLG